jgi:hypothetical protein
MKLTTYYHLMTWKRMQTALLPFFNTSSKRTFISVICLEFREAESIPHHLRQSGACGIGFYRDLRGALDRRCQENSEQPHLEQTSASYFVAITYHFINCPVTHNFYYNFLAFVLMLSSFCR